MPLQELGEILLHICSCNQYENTFLNYNWKKMFRIYKDLFILKCLAKLFSLIFKLHWKNKQTNKNKDKFHIAENCNFMIVQAQQIQLRKQDL